MAQDHPPHPGGVSAPDPAAPTDASSQIRATTTPGPGTRSVWARRAVLMALPLAGVGAYLGWRAHTADGQNGDGTSSQLAIAEFAPADRTAALALAGPGLEGEDLDVADYRGSVVVVNVWGSWCAPCRAEAPVLTANAVAYVGQGVQFLGVNVQDTPAAARAFERTYAITYPSIDDSINDDALLTLRKFVPASAIPSTLILDVQGRVAARVIGVISDVTLRTLLDTVLAESTDTPAAGDDPASPGGKPPTTRATSAES